LVWFGAVYKLSYSSLETEFSVLSYPTAVGV